MSKSEIPPAEIEIRLDIGMEGLWAARGLKSAIAWLLRGLRTLTSIYEVDDLFVSHTDAF